MKNRTLITVAALLGAATISCQACDKRTPDGGLGASGTSKAVTSPSPTDGSSSTAPAATPKPPVHELVGMYVISEVDDNGKASMVNPNNGITLFFEAGGFTRITKENGKVAHTDGGNYRIEGTDQLVLVSNVSDKQPLITPSEKTHKFELSSDGDELKLWGTGGRIAIFRRETEGK
jgi:hypothetical protein